MENIQEKISQLDYILVTQQASVIQHLNDGKSFEDIAHFFDRYNIKLKEHDDLSLLYQWHNGTRINELPAGYFYLFPTFYFMSMDDIEKTVLESNSFYSFKEAGLIPILSSGDDYISFDVNAEKNKPRLYYSTISNTDMADIHTPIFDSIDSMLYTLILCFKNNIFQKKDFYFEIIYYNLYKKIATFNNPLSEYWKSQEW
jgi:hypothetical protein